MFVPKGITFDDNATNADLFLNPTNIKFLISNMRQLHTRYGIPNLNLTEQQMHEYINNYDFTDESVAGNKLVTLSYYNKKFVDTYHPITISDDNTTPDVNYFKIKPFNKPVSQWHVEDYRCADLWSDQAETYVDKSIKQRTRLRGLNNPHILGSHKRHYEHDISETLTAHEVGPTRPHGYVKNNKILLT